ncbi:MAG: iron hydrogenase small subunit [Acholeplasmataceae bacterium]|nr:iron hydrogenase small subunit [Acholeplasmataceae bacterium]
MVNLVINNAKVSVEENTSILKAAKQYNMDIPTLCYYEDLNIKSDCRVCVIEVEGKKGLVSACSTPVTEGMVVYTNSPRVLNARKTIVELILSNHDTNCTTCVKNMKCELQSLARNLGIDENRFPSVFERLDIDDNNPSIVRNPNLCIKCGRCVDVCKNVQGTNVLATMGRGHLMQVAAVFKEDLNEDFCTFCGQCASVCPVGAITEKDNTDLVWNAIMDPGKHVIVQVAPAVRVSLGEEIDQHVGDIVTGKIVSAMRLLGFDRVFDTDFTADLTIIEEGNELIHRVTNGGVLPMMTSCCPGWINYAETRYPDILDHLSSCKSPQQMFGALAKSYYAEKSNLDPKDVFVVSIMPCTAKKYEAQREEMSVNGSDPDVDVVLTTRELGKMIKQMGINFNGLEEQEFDSPFGITTGAGAIFGATGGVMEAAIRTVYEVVNKKPLENLDFKDLRGLDGIKEAEVNLGGSMVKVAVAHTLANAKVLCDQIRDGKSPYAFIEIMTCPGGCIGGGGQPYGTTNKVRQERINTTYRLDANMAIRKSHENPQVTELYEDYLEKPLGEKSHHLLHTHYHDRKRK